MIIEALLQLVKEHEAVQESGYEVTIEQDPNEPEQSILVTKRVNPRLGLNGRLDDTRIVICLSLDEDEVTISASDLARALFIPLASPDAIRRINNYIGIAMEREQLHRKKAR